MPGFWFYFCVASIFSAPPVLAQDAATHTFKTGPELLNAPQKYIGDSIFISDGFCVYDEPSVVCFRAETPFEVKASSLADPQGLARLMEKCGDDLPGKEHYLTPDCKYLFSFVPSRVKKRDWRLYFQQPRSI